MSQVCATVARPVARPVVAKAAFGRARPAALVQARRVMVFSAPDPKAVETAIENAKEACKDGSAGECATAWDEVEELSAAAAHAKAAAPPSDPLEEFCEASDENKDTPECRVFDD